MFDEDGIEGSDVSCIDRHVGHMGPGYSGDMAETAESGDMAEASHRPRQNRGYFPTAPLMHPGISSSNLRSLFYWFHRMTGAWTSQPWTRHQLSEHRFSTDTTATYKVCERHLLEIYIWLTPLPCLQRL